MLCAVPLLTRLTATAAVPAAPLAAGVRPAAVMVIGDHPEAAFRDEDDILAPAAQAAIQRMIDALARFRPTVVAVEWPAAVAAERYARHLAGTLPASRSEVVQLGFRLARKTGARIVGVAAPGEVPSPAALCRALSAAAAPGERMVVFHGSSHNAPLRRCVAATPGLKLVEASAWLAL